MTATSDRETPSPRQQAWDVATGAVCTAVAVGVHLTGSQAVALNHDPSVLSVALTMLAVGPLVVRRRHPMTALVLTLLGLLLLVATRNTVGISTIGSLGAFYTTLALETRRSIWLPVGVMAGGITLGLALRPVDLSGGGAASTATFYAVAGLLGYGARQRRERFEADVVASDERAARALTDERLRIARELHDIIGHAVSVMVVQAGVAERLLDTDPGQAREAVARVGATGRASLAEMRQVLGSIRDEAEGHRALTREPTPGLDDVPALAARVRAAGLPVSVNVTGVPRPLPPGLELAAYRVVQEALTNCLKHAQGSHAEVRLRYDEDALRVVVIDDGDSPAPASPQDGHGLSGMQERVSAFGGELTAGPSAAGGFCVDARLPVKHEHAATAGEVG